MANREAEYYLARAQEIRRRGGNEELARQMENYANNLSAGIYNDTVPAWQPPAPAAAPTPAPAASGSPTGKRSGGQRERRQAPPVQHVISPNQGQPVGVLSQIGNYGLPPEDGVPVVQRPEIYNNNVADFRRLNDTNNMPALNNASSAVTATGNYGTPPEDDVPVVQRDRMGPPENNFDAYRSNESSRSGLLDAVRGLNSGNMQSLYDRYFGVPAGNGILPQRGSYMNISAPSNNNVADFRRLNDTNNIPDTTPIYDFGASPIGMVAEAEKPIQYANKPSGHRELTQFYAQQLKDSGYERNEGKDGIHYGDSGLVNRMRDLRGIIPYNESDGTNCARTVSVALDGTPYSGMFNVDEIVNKARANGQLINPASGYVPQAGDLAVTNGGDHVVMVTENGGVIQNGQSHNGVYETTKPPTEQKGGVKYYVRTSDYNNAFPSFHADLSLGEWNFDNPFDVK